MLNCKPMLTGNYPFPIQINQGAVFARDDMTVAHEEADTIIIQQVASVGAANTLIIAADTYVFGLLCHFVQTRLHHLAWHYDFPNEKKDVIDISESDDNTRPIMGDLLEVHCRFTGRDKCGTESSHNRNTIPL